MYCNSIYVALATTLVASANAHFFISKPEPIPGSGVKPPLDASGSDFPCHGVDLSAGTVTPMAVGSQQPLEFDLGDGANTAVHGGGSCQVSICYSTDAAAQKDPANWKVIHSWLGGCPTNAKGNLANAVACPKTDPECVNNDFTFTIPPEVENGDAVLAWTWFNNIGNREMYMNCARVSISGGSGQLDSLPGLAVANLASINSCKTTEQFNTQFANPGNYVTNDPTLNYPLKAMVGSSCDGGAGTGGGSSPSTGGGNSGSGGSQSPAAESPAAESPAATTTANNGQYTPPPSSGSGNQGSQGGVFAPGAAAPTATQIATTFVTAPAPAATNAPASPPASSPSSGSDSGPSGSCSSGQVSCSASGFYCIDANTFGMCAWGCATPMQMAAGTECMEGAVQAKVVVPSYRKRSMRHLHARAHAVSPL